MVFRVRGELFDGLVARGDLEIVVAQLDPDGLSDIALALQVLRDLLAQVREDGAQLGAVAHRVQVALEGGLAAHRHRLALGHHRPLVAAPGHLVHPGAVALPKFCDQPVALARRELADGADAERCELLVGLGPDAVDLAARQRPDARLQVVLVDHRDAVGLVELARDLGQQLVGRDADRAGEPVASRIDRWISRASTRPPSRWPPGTSVKSMYISSMPRSSITGAISVIDLP